MVASAGPNHARVRGELPIAGSTGVPPSPAGPFALVACGPSGKDWMLPLDWGLTGLGLRLNRGPELEDFLGVATTDVLRPR